MNRLAVLRAEWDRLLGWALAATAAVALLTGGRAVAGSRFGSDAVAHLVSGGVGGLILLACSLAALLCADLRDEATKLADIETALGRSAGPAPGRGVRLACLGLGAVGIIVVVVGWGRAARTADLDRALGGLAVAAVGALLVAAGVAVHILANRQRVRVRVGALMAAYAGGPADVAAVDDVRRYTADGLSRYHRRACPALASAPGPSRPVDGVSGLEPCLICHLEG